MAYKRKTTDEWQVQVYYGSTYGWEVDTVETTRKEAREQLKCYRANVPYPVRLVKRRVKIETNNNDEGVR